MKKCYYNVNLDGVDGAMGEQGPIGPTGPTGPNCISETCNELFLNENVLIIPFQECQISYYQLILNDNNIIENIDSNLKSNQQANIIIKLNISQENSKATIYPIYNLINNYVDNITLDANKPYVIMNLTRISNNIFNNCVNYYNNFLNIKI